MSLISRPFISWPSYLSIARSISFRVKNSTTLERNNFFLSNARFWFCSTYNHSGHQASQKLISLISNRGNSLQCVQRSLLPKTQISLTTHDQLLFFSVYMINNNNAVVLVDRAVLILSPGDLHNTPTYF